MTTQTLNIALCLQAGRNCRRTDRRTDERTIRLLDAPGGPFINGVNLYLFSFSHRSGVFGISL